ncbi:alpha-amylase family glycosyl hydrolase [Ureibacillus manganicus]|uniref:Alpha-amlyase n=1 Tax=Ureibacillus manganicus DSM 26584 TaxID=1384049 RepID=A0A0A3ICM4_9BACL|nr:alpha-amylase family glycosyl hydrolase [Ureibacillus manganicus]KGR80573.1 alpha-amlyase [Ureibacillus manganicus DSM 26584]
MKITKWISTIAATVLAASLSVAPIVSAEETRTIADESIYDLLVDRYFNGTSANDLDSNSQDPTYFTGGDFVGIIQQLSQITKMGFTVVSLGSVFPTEQYDGSLVTTYTGFEPRFGTEEEFKTLVSTLNNNKIKTMIDFPISFVSENHEWAQDPSKANWVLETSDGQAKWDLSNVDVQQALLKSVVEFASTYDIGGVRLTNLDGANTDFINELIAAIKEVNPSIYVISNEQSDADFDASYFDDTYQIYRSIYKNVDQDSSQQLKNLEAFMNGEGQPTQLMVDHTNSDRFIMDVEAHPPTRVKLSIASTLLLPGLPVMQYGTEIAMNGEAGPESHQIYNFKTDSELVDYIKNVQTLRNSSDTLRNGEFKLIENENGLLTFMRSSDTEKWIVVINNTGMTQRIDISGDLVGEGKELQGMLESELVRVNDEGTYPIVLDREIVEIFQVIDERGINVAYLAALGLVYIIFIAFIVAIMRKAKRNKTANNK